MVLCAFDFDATLACGEVSFFTGHERMAGEFGGAERIALLRAMLVELTELGARCVVVSFNSKDTINRALRAVGLIDLFDGIYGSEHELLEGLRARKSALLTHLRRGSEPVLFADDNGGNVRDVVSALPATHAILVPPKPGGMLAEQMQAAVAWARAQRDAAPQVDEAGAVADAIASTHIDSLV